MDRIIVDGMYYDLTDPTATPSGIPVDANGNPTTSPIGKYQADSVVEARNFEILRERLQAAGLGDQAEQFFRCSGALSRDCYKNNPKVDTPSSSNAVLFH